MRIVVNNKQEKKLFEKFFRVLGDSRVFDVMANLDGDPKDLKHWILESELLTTTVTVDKAEPGIVVDPDLVTGTCRICGCQTEGTEDGEGITYSEYLWFVSPAAQAEWLCGDCGSNMCECCNEHLMVSWDYCECANCLYDFPEVY